MRTVELDPFEIGDDALHFRIEIQQRAGQPVFRTRVFRIEAFQMHPLVDPSRESTEFVLLNDDTYTDPHATSPTAEAALVYVLAALQRQFG